MGAESDKSGFIRPIRPLLTLIIPSYIYPILDWGDKPGEAVAIVLGGCVVMPLMQVLTNPTIALRASGGPSPS